MRLQVGFKDYFQEVKQQPGIGNCWYVVEYGMGETLVKLNKNMELEPWLATAWKQIDPLTWEIQLREKVKFSNGKEVTAEAVKASLEQTLKANSRATELWDANSIEAKDNTIIIKTNKPNPALIANLVDPCGVIADVEAAQRMGDAFKEAPVLTGPFKIVKFVKDTEVTVERNEQYWGKKANLSKVVFKFIPDENTRIMALQSGKIDLAFGLPEGSLGVFTKDSNYSILNKPTPRVHMLVFNLRKPIFQDSNVRKAVNLAIDRESLANDVMKWMAVAAVGPFPLILPFGGTDLKAYNYNPEEAKKMLEQAGWVLGSDNLRKKGNQALEFTITTYPSRPELPLLAEAIQAQLKEIGVRVKIQVVENIKPVMESGKFDACMYSMNTAATGDPQYFLETFFKSQAAAKVGNYNSPKVDQLVADLKTAFQVEKRQEIAKEAQQAILDDGAFAFLVYPNGIYVAKSSVKNLTLHPLDFYFLDSDLKIE